MIESSVPALGRVGLAGAKPRPVAKKKGKNRKRKGKQK